MKGEKTWEGVGRKASKNINKLTIEEKIKVAEQAKRTQDKKKK